MSQRWPRAPSSGRRRVPAATAWRCARGRLTASPVDPYVDLVTDTFHNRGTIGVYWLESSLPTVAVAPTGRAPNFMGPHTPRLEGFV